jgi:predicted dehydrogenase
MLRHGRVGTITHITVVDRRTNGGGRHESAPGEYAQLRTAAIHVFDSLRRVLGTNPLNIVARCTTPPWHERPHGATTEALVEMDGNIHVQYYGSLVSSHDEYTLRVHGDRGVLRSSHWCISWRRRGWPLFVPIWFTAGRERMLQHGRPPSGGEDALWSVAMIEAAIRSDRSGRVVPVADVLAEIGPMNSAPAAFGQRQ